jgi:hypothetical protein
MPQATVRASARSLPEPTERPPQPAEELQALAADFEVALEALRPFFFGSGSDDDADAMTARLREVSQKIVAIPTADVEMMRLKARIYLWSEAKECETFAAEIEDGDWSDEALVSLFRDLGVGYLFRSDEDGKDPVLALVARCRREWNNFGEALEKTGASDDEQARRAFEAALARLLETPPTTLAGAREAIAWFAEYDEPNIPETSGAYLRTLIRSPIFAQEEART